MKTHDADVVVVGAGACGMVTALRAAQNPDRSVVIFEKNTRHGCNTQFSSGSLAAGGTRFQADAKVVDSPEQHAADILAASKDPDSAPLVDALCRVAPHYVEWLAGDLRYPIELGLDMQRAGQSVARLHTDTGRQGGRRLTKALRDAISATSNIAFVDNTPVVDLLERGDVATGVAVREQTGVRAVSAAHVVLASDGFGNNVELIEQHCPDASGAFYAGVSSSTGDALRWGLNMGAATRNLGSYLGHGLVVAGHGTRLNPNLPFLGALLVDDRGRRFCDETAQGYSKLGRILQAQPQQRAVLIWDEPAMLIAENSELMRESAAAKAYHRYDTIDSLASGLGLPAPQLADTIGGFSPTSTLVDRPTRRLSAPWYAAWVTRGLLATQGGLHADTEGRVLREDGSPILGLSAGGGAAAGISGPTSEGYSSGNGLLTAMGMGWIIGNRLAKCVGE